MKLYVIDKGKAVTITSTRGAVSSNTTDKPMTFMAQDLVETKDGQYHFRYQSINYYAKIKDVRIV